MKLPRFSLRELFLLVVIAAMGCGWWASEVRHKERLNETVKNQQKLAHYWATSEYSPAFMLQPGQKMEATYNLDGFAIRIIGEDCTTETEFLVEPNVCGVTTKPKP